ncbi:MAGE family-domain-containing protein [Cladorrhinum sp. PSN332]|nr:MAGE family-domain-containing protein [Cladorrhinum sp. PSN332]
MPRTQRRNRVDDDEDEEMQHVDSTQHGGSDNDEHMEDAYGGRDDETSQLVKKLVRYALACEFSRTKIRRDGIRDRVLGPNSREFQKVFAGAQRQLQATFGMEMVELPVKDRALMTTEQKRKAAKSQSQKETTSKAYVLVSTLPEELRKALTPSKVSSEDGEAAYTAIYTLLISIITLSGGELSDPRLRRQLARLNVDNNMPSMNPNDSTNPSEKTELVLQRMAKQGYLVKVTENKTYGDDDSTTWHVGPRGKVEVDNESIARFIRTVYGGSTEEIEQKLQASLQVQERKPARMQAVTEEGEEEEEQAEEEEEEEVADGDPGPSHRRSGRRR